MCPTCGKAFRVRANYYKHRKIHERTTAEQQQQDQQNHNEQLQEQREAQQTAIHPVVGDDISNVTVTLPTPQPGLLETFTVSICIVWYSCVFE